MEIQLNETLMEALRDKAENSEVSVEEVIAVACREYIRQNVDLVAAGSFECHVTFDTPKSLHERAYLKTLIEKSGFKYSAIDGDPVLGQKVFTYATRYGASMTDLINDMHALDHLVACQRLPQAVRKKVERIVYDTKKGGLTPYAID